MEINHLEIKDYNGVPVKLISMSKEEINTLPLISNEGTTATVREFSKDYVLKVLKEQEVIDSPFESLELLGYQSKRFLCTQALTVTEGRISGFLVKKALGRDGIFWQNHAYFPNKQKLIEAIIDFEQELTHFSKEGNQVGEVKEEHFFYSSSTHLLQMIDTDDCIRGLPYNYCLKVNRSLTSQTLIHIFFSQEQFCQNESWQKMKQEVEKGFLPLSILLKQWHQEETSGQNQKVLRCPRS